MPVEAAVRGSFESSQLQLCSAQYPGDTDRDDHDISSLCM